jgi:hypothetical protein
MDPPDRPALSRATPHAPAFLSADAALTVSATRDAGGERVVLLSWHQGAVTRIIGNDNAVQWSGQMELTELDATRLRDFLDAWLALVPPPEPREAA